MNNLLLMKVSSMCFYLMFSFNVQAYSLQFQLEKSGQAVVTEKMQEVGKAKFSVLFWDIYQSRLLTQNGKFEHLSQDVIFEITYLKDINKEDLLTRTVEQWQHLEIAPEMYQQFTSPLLTIWPNIKAGDSLLMRVENGISEFYFNQTYIGQINDERFAPLFLSIWLAPNTSQPDLRAQLLGIKPAGE